jgi:hypothetical protein
MFESNNTRGAHLTFLLLLSIKRVVRVKLYQAFLLSGGPYGRLARGDELVLMEFSKGEDMEEVQNITLELPTSL